jgi:hypothetical protein
MEMWRKAEFEGERIVIDALVRRRAAEKTLFLTPTGAWTPAPSALLRPLLDDERDFTPREPARAVAPKLTGGQAEVVRVPEPAPEPEVAPPQAQESPVQAAAEQVSARLQTLFADARQDIPAFPVQAPQPAPVEPPPAELAPAPEQQPEFQPEPEPQAPATPPEVDEYTPTRDLFEPELVEEEPAGAFVHARPRRVRLDFALGETADMIRETTARFSADRIAPIAAKVDETNTFPRELWPQMGELGLHGITVEEEFGGLGLGYLEHVVAMEEVSRASASVGLSYGAHSNLCVNQIRRWGTPEQKHRYLPKLISGEHVGSLAMSEAGAGSDVISMGLAPRRRATSTSSTARSSGSPTPRTPTPWWSTPRPTRPPARRASPPSSSRRGRGLQRLQEARQDGHARLGHRRAGVRGLRGSGRERHGPDRRRRRGADERPRL